jgi:hypothetical protein
MWRFRRSSTQVLGLLLAGCVLNTPPLYESRAAAFLKRQGVAEAVIEGLTHRQPLTPAEVRTVLQYKDTAALFLLASNDGTPAHIVEKLASSDDVEVRWGAAMNPKLSVDTMTKLRTPGKYSTINGYLARNPALPLDVLRAMYKSNEAGKADIAMNPSCPPDLVDAILADQPEDVRLWLSFNRGLGPAAWTRLEADPSPSVVKMLQSNRAYVRWKRDEAPREAGRPGG